MKSGSLAGGVAAAAVFVLLSSVSAFLPSSPAGIQDYDTRAAQLEETGESMLDGARLHSPVAHPGYPEPAPFCKECHTLPPHPGSGPVPAFLNHHSTLFDCIVCHWAKSSGSRPEAVWDTRPAAGKVPGAEAIPYLRLAGTGGGGVDHSRFREEAVKRQKCFDRGLSCNSCHRRGGLEPYSRPGLSPQAAAAMENLPDFFTLSKGAKWYFPQRSLPGAP